MLINIDKTKIMAFYETIEQKQLRDSSDFFINRRFPTPSKWTIDEVEEFTYLGLLLDPALFIYKAAEHACQKLNWAHLTIAAVAHNLRHDTPLEFRHTRSSPLILFRLWQSFVIPFATQNLRNLTTQTQVQKVLSTLLRSLHRTFSCYTVHDILMQEFGIAPLKLQQAMQLVSMHFRYSVTHTNLPAAHLYHLRRARMCALSHLPNSIESRIKEACNELRLPDTSPGPPQYPLQCNAPKNKTKASPTPLGSNSRSTTDGTSFLAPQSQHTLAKSTTPTYPSPRVHKHTTESDSTPPTPNYSNYPIT
jgi:hypothetical protein